MSAEAKLHADLAAAQRAELVLGEVGHVIDQLKQDYLGAWANTSARDTDARERLFLAVQVVEKVRAHFQAKIQHGRLAKVELMMGENDAQ
ncbi:MAG: hypothetical protein K2Q10_14125 [Rhodospirillales bacterium]|nr:hypothetical protein [Rhodospirillales bacterium]